VGEIPSPGHISGHGKRSHRNAMITQPARHNQLFSFLSQFKIILMGDLGCHFRGFRSAGHKKNPIQISGCQFSNPARQFLHRFTRKMRPENISNPVRRGGICLTYFLDPMADIHHNWSRRSIDVFLAVTIIQVNTFAFFNGGNHIV